MEGLEIAPSKQASSVCPGGSAPIHRRRSKARQGQTLTEYSLILVLIVLAVVATLTLLSDVVQDVLWSNTISNALKGEE